MPITLKEVRTKKEMKQFVYLPEKIHAGHQGWIPPIYADDMWTFNARKNPAHEYCESFQLLAYDGPRIVGRVAGIINRRYNDYAKTSSARFGFLEATEDFEVTKALVEYVENWAREKGIARIVGPMGYTEEDPLGFIFEGYHETPSLACIQNLPWMNEYMERLGYAKELDYFVYKLDIKTAMSDLYAKMFERISKNKAFRLLEFKSKKEVRPWVKPVFELMNESFDQIYGYSPLDEADVELLAKRYMPLLDPRFIKAVVTPENQMIGFMVSFPNMAPGIIKARGRLLPFGILHIIRAAKKAVQLDNYLGAVKKEFRGKGVDILMGYAQMRQARDAGFEFMDSHHEMEENLKMRAEMERSGGVVYKKYRLYFKEL
ncbi:MAG: hypothetical protein K0B87_07165 [Candidatus Syntrophosphaera sp.]|nr:hypothetical protein [Candidatus Syntrophosphaera sp.]